MTGKQVRKGGERVILRKEIEGGRSKTGGQEELI
jgi:hypothetical protein